LYYAHKNVKGRKRHLLVDSPGLPLSNYVSRRLAWCTLIESG
jgi:hypothetical protein